MNNTILPALAATLAAGLIFGACDAGPSPHSSTPIDDPATATQLMRAVLAPLAAASYCIETFGESTDLTDAIAKYNERNAGEIQSVINQIEADGGLSPDAYQAIERAAAGDGRLLLGASRQSGCAGLSERYRAGEFDLAAISIRSSASRGEEEDENVLLTLMEWCLEGLPEIDRDTRATVRGEYVSMLNGRYMDLVDGRAIEMVWEDEGDLHLSDPSDLMVIEPDAFHHEWREGLDRTAAGDGDSVDSCIFAPALELFDAIYVHTDLWDELHLQIVRTDTVRIR
jgi:hypothetical protein